MLVIENSTDIMDICRGAVLLGTGGGGDPYVGQLLLEAQLEKGRKTNVIPLEAVDDASLVITIAGMGSPPVMLENLASEKTLLKILSRANILYGRNVDALISAEIGGINSMFPLALSAMSGLPVLDGDGVGRAVPRTEMCTFSIHGCRATPAILADELGNTAVVDAIDDLTAESMLRAITVSLGASLFGAFYQMTGAQVKACAVPATLTLTQKIGRCIRNARESSRDIFAALLTLLNSSPGRYAKILFDGKIIDVTHETRDGWHWGRVTLAALGQENDLFTVDIQNEFTIARRNGKMVTVVPDLISILDRESGEPITAERLSYGLRVKVLGYSADSRLRRPEALAVLGPHRFGLDEDFLPLESIV